MRPLGDKLKPGRLAFMGKVVALALHNKPALGSGGDDGGAGQGKESRRTKVGDGGWP